MHSSEGRVCQLDLDKWAVSLLSPLSDLVSARLCFLLFLIFCFSWPFSSVAIFLQVRYYWRYFDNKSSTLFKHLIFLSSFSYFLKTDASLQGIELANRDLQSISLSFSVAQRKLSINWTQSSDDNCSHNSIKMLCILMNPIFSLIFSSPKSPFKAVVI